MDRRRFLLTSLAGALGAPLAAEAQQAGKVYTLACLWASPAPRVEPYRKALIAGLAERGWTDGRNVRLEHRYPESPADIPGLAAELLAGRPDVVLAVTNPVIEVVRRATPTIPIVMLYAVDPVGSGFIKSFAKPSTNVTGLTFDPAPELFTKNVEFLSEALPRARHVGMLWNPQFYAANAAAKLYIERVTTFARTRSLRLISLEVTNLSDIERAFRWLESDRTDALLIIPDPFVTFQHFPTIAAMSTSRRLPSIYAIREYVEAGGLLRYGPSIIDQPRYATGHIDRLFRGGNAADIPVEQPSKYELAVNLKTAKALGLTIPPSVLARADQVIE